MNLNRKTLLALAVSLSILVVGSSVIIYGSVEDEAGNYPMKSPERILKKASEILGVEEDKLLNALSQAFQEVATERIDKLVAEEWLGEKRAEIMKGKIEKLSDQNKIRFLKFFICGRGQVKDRFGKRMNPGTFPKKP